MTYNLSDLTDSHSANTINKALSVGKLSNCHRYIELPDNFDFGDKSTDIKPISMVIVNHIATIKETEWPLLLRPFKLLSKPEDTGLGDIVERMIGTENSEAFKSWWQKNFNKQCGCDARKEWLNKQFRL